MHYATRHHAFTLVELLVGITVLTVLMGFGVTTLTSVIRDTRFKAEVANVDNVIRKTLNECLIRGREGRIVIGKVEGDTEEVTDTVVRGFYLDDDASLVELFRYGLTHATFTRTNGYASPWMGTTVSGSASTFADDTLMITATGMVSEGGAFFLQYTGSDEEAVVEVLANGTVDTFYPQGENDEGEVVWVR